MMTPDDFRRLALALPDATEGSHFGNPDFVKYAESFGARGFRVEKTEDLPRILQEALASETVCVIDCPVDYRENIKLTEQMGTFVCPI